MSIRWDTGSPFVPFQVKVPYAVPRLNRVTGICATSLWVGACGECHFVSAGGQDIQTEAVVCPFIGTDVRQIDRKIAIQFIKFDGRFVHIGLVCRTIDNIDPAFCAKQPVHRMGVHEETADVGGTTLQFAALQGTVLQRGENVVVILCTAGAYHVNIVQCHCHGSEVGLVDCLSAGG